MSNAWYLNWIFEKFEYVIYYEAWFLSYFISSAVVTHLVYRELLNPYCLGIYILYVLAMLISQSSIYHDMILVKLKWYISKTAENEVWKVGFTRKQIYFAFKRYQIQSLWNYWSWDKDLEIFRHQDQLCFISFNSISVEEFSSGKSPELRLNCWRIWIYCVRAIREMVAYGWAHGSESLVSWRPTTFYDPGIDIMHSDVQHLRIKQTLIYLKNCWKASLKSWFHIKVNWFLFQMIPNLVSSVFTDYEIWLRKSSSFMFSLVPARKRFQFQWQGLGLS